MGCCWPGGKRSGAGSAAGVASGWGSSTPGTQRRGKGLRTVFPSLPPLTLPHLPYPTLTPSPPPLPSPYPSRLPRPCPFPPAGGQLALIPVAVRPGRFGFLRGADVGAWFARERRRGSPGPAAQVVRFGAVQARPVLPSPHLTSPPYNPPSPLLSPPGAVGICGRRFPRLLPAFLAIPAFGAISRIRLKSTGPADLFRRSMLTAGRHGVCPADFIPGSAGVTRSSGNVTN